MGADRGARVSDPMRGRPSGRPLCRVLRVLTARGTGEGDALELYFGATSGDVFGSGEAGAAWSTAATRLPPVLSISGRS